jgi:hypothetical protein
LNPQGPDPSAPPTQSPDGGAPPDDSQEQQDPQEVQGLNPDTLDARVSGRKKDVEIQSAQPQSPIDPYKVKIPQENRFALGSDLMQQIQQGLGDRTTFNVNLDLYEQLYEMHVEEKNVPWPNSSNVFIPMIPEIVDTMAARLASLVFQPRFFVVNGNTPEAANVQAQVERYLNAEMSRNNWVEPLFMWLQQGLLYGVGILGIFWKRRVVSHKKVFYQQKMDPETNLPVIDPATNAPMSEKVIKMVTDVEYDDVELTNIPLKEFVVFPSWARSIDTALGCARVIRPAEAELWAMVKSGELWADETEKALAYKTEGLDERPEDSQGSVPITADEQITISGGTTNFAPYRRQRGPLKLWQVHTDQYDMDNDGIPEENIFWVHESSRRCLGYTPYAYWHGRRPYGAFTGLPRDQVFYGFSIPGRLLTLQTEMNTKENQKNDAIDRSISPTRVIQRGATLNTQDNRSGPDSEWEVDGPVGEAVAYLSTPEVPLSTWQEQSWLYERAMTMVGLNSPMMGGQSSGRRSAREVQSQMQSAGIRLDLIANRLRESMRQVAYQIVQLKLQYGPEESAVTMVQQGVPQKLVLPKKMLAEDLDIDIIGAGGPLDRVSRASDMMILYTLLMRNPLVMSNQIHVYNVTQMMLEEHNRPDVQALIGTQEEAQQAQQQQQMMQQVQALMAAHGQQQGQPGQQGKPGGQQQQQQPQPPQGGGGMMG